MKKVIFVLLHYENKQETINCITSLEKYLDKNVEIVVVDNGSQKEALHDVQEDYSGISGVHFIISKKNLGFAKGNNLGFQYAKKELNPDIIILSNSDTIYNQDDFIEVLNNDYDKTAFDIAGPRIIRIEDMVNQNPSPQIYHHQSQVFRQMIKFFVLYLLSYINLDLLLRGKPEKYDFNTDGIINTKYDNYQLHGACLIFGKNYIKKYDGLYPKTFMYGEESILKYIAERDNLKMIYLDNISLDHLEGVSVASVFGKGRKNRNFYYKWNLHSCHLLYKLMGGEKRK
ncbi:glycosyltransferase family 2 protein [Streptococcus sp. zg-JUN1979]|uniref:glycosyltransferase family 2 protein n=1 Tax=Streptococcus sp. zg-JUN1979 TaxID=3391450 RepID=UPI0039A51C5B